jgi:hypothetical protein
VPDHPADRLRLEQVTLVDEPPGQHVRPLIHLYAQVEPRHRRADVRGLQPPSVRQRRRLRLEPQQHLHQRVTGRAPFRRYRPQLHVLLLARRLGLGPRPAQQLAHAGFAAQIRPQYQHAGEQPRRLLWPPPRYRPPEQQVFLPGVAVQQCFDRRGQRHPQAYLFPSAELPQPGRQSGPERERLCLPPPARLSRPPVVGGQLKHRGSTG